MSLKSLKQELTVAKSERAMLVRRGQSTSEIDAKITQIKVQIDATGATVAQVNVAGQFTKDDEVTQGQLDVRDADLTDSIGDMSKWGMLHFWR